ncbi:MAG: hypothetical protein IT173_13870 [Acidobacteria bacterium]|nr:hypothetical protein [Acidobacteriota bacterium]
MNAYYLWDPFNSIIIGSVAYNDSESKFLVEVKRPNGLQPALDQLGVLATSYGKKVRLEVHCHGDPGILHLGDQRAISNLNVRTFGAAVRQAVVPGGLIELLTCLVASQVGDGNLLTAPKHRIMGYREDYHGALRLRRTREYDKAMRFTREGTVGADGKAVFSEPKWTMGRAKHPHYGGRFTLRENPIQEDPNAYFRPDFSQDGLRFCVDLAISSGCTVRAAVAPQYEEGGLSENRRLAGTPIGNWEYEVFDFNPDGRIQFLGSSPYRGPINSFDQIRSFPTA